MNDNALRGDSLSEAEILFNKEKNYMKVSRKIVSLRLSPELIKMITVETEEQRRSFSNLTRRPKRSYKLRPCVRHTLTRPLFISLVCSKDGRDDNRGGRHPKHY